MGKPLSAHERKRKVFELAAEGMRRSDIADAVECSKGRVTQILAATETPDLEEELSGSARVLAARAKLLELQGQALARKLKIESGELIRTEYLDKILLAFLRHFEAQTNWIRSNRLGDTELLEAHLASVKGAQRECHKLKITEGENIDEE